MITVSERTYTVTVGDVSRSPVSVDVDGEAFQVEIETPAEQKSRPSVRPPATNTPPPPASPATSPSPVAASADSRLVVAPMPGKILQVRVKPGDQVSQGDVLCVLEAMKMEQFITAARSGVIAAVRVRPDEPVSFGAVLVEFES